MQPRSVEERLSMLEQQMQELRDLPQRVTKLESQFVQLQREMRDGFSAIRSEIKEGFAELGRQMRMLHEEALARIATIGEARKRGRRN